MVWQLHDQGWPKPQSSRSLPGGKEKIGRAVKSMKGSDNWAYVFHLVENNTSTRRIVEEVRHHFLDGRGIKPVNYSHLTKPPKYRDIVELPHYHKYYGGIGDLMEVLMECEEQATFLNKGFPTNWGTVLRHVHPVMITHEWEPVSDWYEWMTPRHVEWPELIGGTGFVNSALVCKTLDQIRAIGVNTRNGIAGFVQECRGITDSNDAKFFLSTWINALSSASRINCGIFSLFSSFGVDPEDEVVLTDEARRYWTDCGFNFRTRCGPQYIAKKT
jgi:hypothetical protein